MGDLFDRKTAPYLFTLVVLVFFLGLAVNAPAADDVRGEARVIINESLEDLWTGRSFSAELRQKQQVLREMLASGDLPSADLEALITEAIRSISDRQKTTRYILGEMPERVNELFSSHMNWERFRELLWLVTGAALEKDRQVVISLATLAPSGTPWLVVPEKLVAEIEELSNNKLSIKIYAGGVMGEDTDILRKMDVGQLDGGGFTALGILAASPETSVFVLPGLFNSYDEVDYIFEKFRKRIDRAFEERGYILGSLIDTGYFYIFSKNKISSLADIRRSKMLSWMGTVETTLFDELGISAMPMSATEIISALSTGMADTNVAPAAWMLGMQTYQYANYFVREPLLYSPGAVVVSAGIRDRLKRQFDLSDEIIYNVQELLVFELMCLEDEWKRMARRYEKRCLEAFETRVGMKAVTLPPADRKAIEQAGRNVWERLADEAYPKDLLDDILHALEEYRQNQP